MPDIASLPTLALVAVFAVAAAIVWTAGTKLAGFVSALADHTGLSGPVAGMLLLGVITSTPEIATSTTAAWRGDVQLAAGDVLGSVALQVVVIAIADVIVGKRALSSTMPSPSLLLQANMGVILLVIVAVGVIVGDVQLLGVGGWPLLLAALYVTTPFLAQAADRRDDPPAHAARAEIEAQRRERGQEGEDPDQPIGGLIGKIGVAGLLILVAGFALATTGGELAERTGLGSSFFGTVFLAGATSLPELSSAIGAARLRRADLAVGDILGSNMINLAMLLLVDAVYGGGPVFDALGPISAVSALLAAVLTLIFMIGLIERRNRSILRMGYDSVAVLVVYACGVAILFQLR